MTGPVREGPHLHGSRRHVTSPTGELTNWRNASAVHNHRAWPTPSGLGRGHGPEGRRTLRDPASARDVPRGPGRRKARGWGPTRHIPGPAALRGNDPSSPCGHRIHTGRRNTPRQLRIKSMNPPGRISAQSQVLAGKGLVHKRVHRIAVRRSQSPHHWGSSPAWGFRRPTAPYPCTSQRPWWSGSRGLRQLLGQVFVGAESSSPSSSLRRRAGSV